MPDSVLQGCRVFVAEDEALIGIVLEDILEELGCVLAGMAATFEEAAALLPDRAIDVAVLDVNLGDAPSYPLADRLIERGVQVIFATGAQRDSLPPRFSACAVLEKPYAFAAVEAALTAAWAATHSGVA